MNTFICVKIDSLRVNIKSEVTDFICSFDNHVQSKVYYK